MHIHFAGYEVEPDWIVKASLVPNDPAWPSISAAMNRIQAPQAWGLHTGRGSRYAAAG